MSILENPLLMQFLGATAQDLLGNTPGKNTGMVVQQQVGAKSMAGLMGMIKDALSGKMGDGTSVKTTASGTTINIAHTPGEPHPLLGGAQEGEQKPVTPTGQPTGGVAPASNPQVSDLVRLMGSFSNGQQVKPSDLAGLSKEDILAAMQLKTHQQALGQKSVTDLADMMFKQQQLGLQERGLNLEERGLGIREEGALTDRLNLFRQMAKDQQGEPLDQRFPVEVPGVGQVTTREWNALPKDTQDYALYANSFPDEATKILTPEQFKALQPTERENFLRKAMDNPKLMEAAKELATAGATNISINEKAETAKAIKKATGGLEPELYFASEKWTDDLQKYMSSKAVANELNDLEDPDHPEVRAKAEMKKKIDWIDQQITNIGGEIIPVNGVTAKKSKDGRTIIWTVKWPSGTVGTVTYAIR